MMVVASWGHVYVDKTCSVHDHQCGVICVVAIEIVVCLK